MQALRSPVTALYLAILLASWALVWTALPVERAIRTVAHGAFARLGSERDGRL